MPSSDAWHACTLMDSHGLSWWHADGTNRRRPAVAAALTPLFGSARKLPSGRWQARYWGPDGRHHTGRTDDGRSLTFSTKRKAVEWLNRTHSDIQSGRWEAPGTRGAPITLKAYAAAWLAERDLAATTRDHYAQMLRDHILPAFGETPVPAITAAAVRTWYADLAKSTGPTSRAHAYGLLRTVLTTAVADELIAANPCRVRGGGSARTVHRTEPATAEQLAVIVAHTPE